MQVMVLRSMRLKAKYLVILASLLLLLLMMFKKTPENSDIVKKTDYDAKIKDFERKYFTISDHNKFTNQIGYAKIKKSN